MNRFTLLLLVLSIGLFSFAPSSQESDPTVGNKLISERVELEPSTESPITETLDSVSNSSTILQDFAFYSLIGLMGLSIMGILSRKRKWNQRLTRWAKAHPVQAIAAITALQLPLMSLSILQGYNLYQMGIDLSDSWWYLGLGMTILGSTPSSPCFPKKESLSCRINVTPNR